MSSAVYYGDKIPVEHLDYEYIGKCRDAKYLEKVLKVLRSGDEGIYPHLITFCENHLEKLNPRSRALRKENPVATPASLPEDEWSQIITELKNWEEEAKNTETLFEQHSEIDYMGDKVPTVRGSRCFIPLEKKTVQAPKKNPSKPVLPRDYREWDKFNVEKECEKVDINDVQKESQDTLGTKLPKIKTEVDSSLLSEQEKLFLANREKDKGNEAFRAKDYAEAVVYYSRSISILPTIVAYNNRAQAEVSLKDWSGALRDCQQVLELDPGNKKALLRRATAFDHLGNFQKAFEDLQSVLRDEPQNPTATQLLLKIQEKMSKTKGEQERSGGTKITIAEEEEEEEEEEVETCSGKETQKQHSACPVQPSRPVGGEESAAASSDRRDMGNSQKKPHGKGNGGAHSESNNSHSGGRRGKGGGGDKYRVPPESKLANGSGGTASREGHQSDKTGTAGGGGGEAVNLDAPCGALPPPLARLKNEGNLFFKNGQFADALEKYSAAIQGCADSGIDSPQDLCILYSNRAACYLKDGNSQDCIEDCTRALELQPFSLKPLLRRAMAYESLERYRKAYVDYKTVLQIDVSVQAAHDSVNRITRVLIEQDGAEWREKLPEIPLVPLSAQQHRREEPPSEEVLQARAQKAARDAERRAEVLFSALKQEGNDYVKKGQYLDAVGKYTECLKLKPEECAVYTNRALCFLKLDRFAEARQDCDAALKLEPGNKKAFYRRALACKGLQDYHACSSDLQEVLRLDPGVEEAQKELEEVSALLRLSQAREGVAKPRKSVPVTEVEDEEDESDRAATTIRRPGEDATFDLKPTSAYDFGQALSAARRGGGVSACARLLAATPPERLPQYLSNQLDGPTVSLIVRALDSQLLRDDPGLVYRHLQQLHTAERFSVVLLQLEKDERRLLTQLFEHLSAVEAADFSKEDVQNLANRYV